MLRKMPHLMSILPPATPRKSTFRFFMCSAHVLIINDRRLSAYAIQPISAFYLFFAAGLIAALFAPIQDCDETFNYWEPAHYLSHGYGLQTWEYSPDYAIRSWLYVALHALVGNVRRILPQSTKVGRYCACVMGIVDQLSD